MQTHSFVGLLLLVMMSIISSTAILGAVLYPFVLCAICGPPTVLQQLGTRIFNLTTKTPRLKRMPQKRVSTPLPSFLVLALEPSLLAALWVELFGKPRQLLGVLTGQDPPQAMIAERLNQLRKAHLYF